MNRRGWSFWAVVAAAFATCSLVGTRVGMRIGVDPGLATLGLAVGLYAILSGVVALQRRRLAQRLAERSPEVRAALRSSHPELRDANLEARPGLSARRAVWVGLAWVNLPLPGFMIGPLALCKFLSHQPLNALRPAVLLSAGAGGFVAAWAWWSVNVTLWRAWAERRGVDPNELQWRGQDAQLLWPRGHVFERTELGKIAESIRRRRSTSG